MRKLLDMMRLEGRAALVTGGCGHIGGAIAETLAELGASVALLDRAETAPAAAALAKRFGVKAIGLDIDLADVAATRAAPARVAEALGSLDILVNNAAYVGASGLSGWAVPFAEQSLESWNAAMTVNLGAVFTLSQQAAPLLARSGHGSMVNIGSIYGLLGPDWSLYEGTSMANPAAYAASKGGLLQFTRWLATTLAPKVRVNAVSPGGVARAGQPEAFRQRYEARTPLGRMAVEEDFKGVIGFLCSDASRYVTGQNIAVDGGWSSW